MKTPGHRPKWRWFCVSIGRDLDGVDLDITRDRTHAEPAKFE